MTRREIAFIAVKLIGIGMIAMAVATASSALGMLFSQIRFESHFFSSYFAASGTVGIMGAAWLIAGFYCWHSAERLAGQMADDDVTLITSPDHRGEDLLSLGSSVIGLFLLLPAIRTLLSAALQFGTGEESFEPFLAAVYWKQIVYGALFEIVFGAWLVFGSRGIAAFIAYWRSAGTSTSPPDEPPASPENAT